LIDHINTNIQDDSFDAGIIISDISDHFPVFYIQHLKETTKPANDFIKTRKFDENSKHNFKENLNMHPWDNIINNNDPVSAFSDFFETINHYYDSSFPEKIIKASNKNKPLNPWMSQALLVSRKQKEKLFTKKIRKPCPENVSKFKEYNATYTHLVRAARKKYYSDKFNEYSNDSKKTWQTINSVLGRSKKTHNIPDLFNSNGKVLSGASEIANGFNDFFANIGQKLASTIPSSEKTFSDYLSEESRENFIFANVTPNILKESLCKLKNKNSSGGDGISTNLLKLIFPEITNPLCHLFNLSFRTAYIPTEMKTAKVIPVFKSGDSDNFTNYRPISLLSSFSKLLEKIAANQMMKYLNKFKLLHEHQYGFRSGYNTTQPIIHFLDNIYKALNKNNPEYTLGIFIDLTKAFDTCDTNILLQKLSHYGFRGVSNTWFKNYLIGRKQFTSIEGENSSLLEITCGVPQGSILGPLLFLILINDLPNASKFFTILFADDTTLQLSSDNLENLYSSANMEMKNLSDWFKANKLTLNTSKTKYILFRRKQQVVDFVNLHLKIDEKEIERIGMGCKAESFKFVGIQIDELLSWDCHLKYIKNKVASASYALSKVKNLLPTAVKYTIYNALCRSFLEYGITAWGSFGGNMVSRISILQKKAIRYIENAKYNSHSDPLFYKYNILKFEDLKVYNQAVFMYKYTYNQLPTSFNNFFTKLRNFDRAYNYFLENTANKMMHSFPSYALPKLWNGLPLDLKRSSSLNIFKKNLLKTLIYKYNVKCEIINCYSCRS